MKIEEYTAQAELWKNLRDLYYDKAHTLPYVCSFKQLILAFDTFHPKGINHKRNHDAVYRLIERNFHKKNDLESSYTLDNFKKLAARHKFFVSLPLDWKDIVDKRREQLGDSFNALVLFDLPLSTYVIDGWRQNYKVLYHPRGGMVRLVNSLLNLRDAHNFSTLEVSDIILHPSLPYEDKALLYLTTRLRVNKGNAPMFWELKE